MKKKYYIKADFTVVENVMDVLSGSGEQFNPPFEENELPLIPVG